MPTQTDPLTAERPPGLLLERAPSLKRSRLKEDAPAGATASGLARRRTRPAVEKLLIANKVPPLEARELLLSALRNVPDDLEGFHLDRRLLQEVHRGLSIPKADRATWLRTLGAPKR